MQTTSTNTVNAYDFDHTIYRGDASFDFIIFSLLRHPALLRYLPLHAWAIFLYVIGKKNRKQIKQVAFSFLKDINDIDDELQHFWVKHEHKVEEWYLKQKKSSDIVISASPEFLLQPIVSKLGIETLIGTKMNKTTGVITGENCRAEEKVSRLTKAKLNVEILNAYSDSMSDLPLLNLAKNAYIVRKSVVRKLEK